MPIINYKQRAVSVEKWFFNNPAISNRNKKLIRQFLAGYDVSDARKIIFLQSIFRLLAKIDNVKTAMQNRHLMNKVFQELRQEYSPSVYATIINVGKRFTKWLNNGDYPHGFQDVKSTSRKNQKRQLNPNDMITWEDGLLLMGQTNSMQIKAIVATQLDGGFRPSEFVDLNYGDVKPHNEFCIVSVRAGKTGPRTVILWRSVPYLLRWLQNHPLKQKNAPLWVQEYNTKGIVIRYKYDAILRRIDKLGKAGNIKKPFDFYNLRHSACTIAKLDNTPDSEAAKKFGHSVEFYTETYGRMSTEDSIKRFSKVYGLEHAEKVIQKSVVCKKCDFVNVPEADFCEKCGVVISSRKALELQQEKDAVKEELISVKAQLAKIDSFMDALVSKNPDVLKVLAKTAVTKRK